MNKEQLQYEAFLDDLMYSEEYAEYIMKHGDPETHPICDGDMLTVAQEEGYLFNEFLESIGLAETV